MDCMNSSTDKNTLKRWFFIDKRVGWCLGKVRESKINQPRVRLIILLVEQHFVNESMDLKSNHNSPVLTDPASLSKSRLGLPSNMTPCSPAALPFSSSGLYLTFPKILNCKLHNAHVNGWLDAIIVSSPRKKLNKDLISECQLDDNDAAYQTWMVGSLKLLKLRI